MSVWGESGLIEISYHDPEADDLVSVMLQFVHLNEENPERGTGFRVDPHWIDPAGIQRWLGHCENNHDACRPYSSSWFSCQSLQNLLLLDVEQNCLVLLPNSTRYFALSYLWGNLPDAAETTMANLSALKHPGTLHPNSTNLKIPQTIRDAMRLIRRLGERYLWVDQFCIIQDDTENKQVHIFQMDFIYYNAHCTIVAADGEDADHGLHGVGLNSCPRSYQQNFLQFPGFQMLEHQKDDLLRWFTSRYNSRGWTFQELCLSRRLLVFFRDRLVWACKDLHWTEDVFDPSPTYASIVSGSDVMKWGGLDLEVDELPNIGRWAALVRGFNKRDLYYPGDAYSAFTGVEKVLARSFPGGFLYGLPEFFFSMKPFCGSRTLLYSAEKQSIQDAVNIGFQVGLGWVGKERSEKPASQHRIIMVLFPAGGTSILIGTSSPWSNGFS